MTDLRDPTDHEENKQICNVDGREYKQTSQKLQAFYLSLRQALASYRCLTATCFSILKKISLDVDLMLICYVVIHRRIVLFYCI